MAGDRAALRYGDHVLVVVPDPDLLGLLVDGGQAAWIRWHRPR